ncbi:Two-component response regulator, YesN/AraC family, consists of REC and AraC-type DNA-binding domains [Paenibacillus sp. UNCCL117]|uniref:response regulator n=1 Tax=unclassified Paenibacillus TaxID=185978 RepID=UPI0008918756|nr:MULTISPECIES: response regulator [unclassified Paenibacillus]SDE25951.1 Two-component response regulator, YesN/AraC family, consists of REC and AraC-type DNA-binding domains [Paenibacillus sp. cl123]SFW62523.1 Two-component response regulator, YesN/AraC family, consists of REC and AraC-type DNA-binding domains [Paenibacillus sp. UNCCL117]
MYKVIIVEDEMLVRLGLKGSVQWDRFGMQVVADFSDGSAALQYCYDEGFPDVVITDIRMPRMDGVELIASIREQNKKTRIIVLTCLEEFELVRRLMSLGVSHYLLKLAMTEDELGHALSCIRAELDELSSAMESPDKKRLKTINLDLVKEKYIKDFLFYGIYSVEEFGQFVVENGFRLTPVRNVVCIMEVDSYFALKHKFRDEHGHLIKNTLLNMLYEITTTCQKGEAVFLDETRYLLLFSFEDLASEQSIVQQIHSMLGTIQEVICTCFNGSASFGISGVHSGYVALRKLYAEAVRALDNKFFAGPGQKHTSLDGVNLSGIHAQVQSIREYAPLREMMSPIKLEQYDLYMAEFVRSLQEGEKPIRMSLYSLLQWLNTNVYDGRHDERKQLQTITETMDCCDTLPEMLEHVQSYLTNLAEQSRSALQTSGDISKAIRYIQMNYDRDISLQQVADHVHLSLGYLSNLFKKELRITFVEFLNGYRIERAKELLTGSRLKTCDIAAKVGFSPEYTYFSKVFKKVTGLNPNEYRKSFNRSQNRSTPLSTAQPQTAKKR